MNVETDKLDVTEIIRLEVQASALALGVTCSAELANSLIERLELKLGGSLFYLPVMSKTSRNQKHAEIRALFNGKNASHLARIYGFSRRHVQRIVNRK